MLTIIGKNLVYVTVIFSLTALGLSLWAAADDTKFGDRQTAVDQEIRKLNAAVSANQQELNSLWGDLQNKPRNLPRGPDEIAANKDIRLRDALAEIETIEKDLKAKTNNLQVDVQARISLINELQSLREKLQAEKDKGKELRLVITPDENLMRQGQRSYRDTIASLQVAKDEAERRTEAMQPNLYNAAIRLQSLELRLQSL